MEAPEGSPSSTEAAGRVSASMFFCVPYSCTAYPIPFLRTLYPASAPHVLRTLYFFFAYPILNPDTSPKQPAGPRCLSTDPGHVVCVPVAGCLPYTLFAYPVSALRVPGLRGSAHPESFPRTLYPAAARRSAQRPRGSNDGGIQQVRPVSGASGGTGSRFGGSSQQK